MSGGRVRRMMICQSRRRRETRDSSERSESSPAPLKQRGLVANNTGTGSGSGASAARAARPPHQTGALPTLMHPVPARFMNGRRGTIAGGRQDIPSENRGLETACTLGAREN